MLRHGSKTFTARRSSCSPASRRPSDPSDSKNATNSSARLARRVTARRPAVPIPFACRALRSVGGIAAIGS